MKDVEENKQDLDLIALLFHLHCYAAFSKPALACSTKAVKAALS